MIEDVLATRLREYAPADTLEQENVLQELMQHYVLASLSRAGLFQEAMFHGGTCLRIIYKTHRFSEDLDFLLKKPNASFQWQPYLERVQHDCARMGLHFELQDRSNAATAVRKAFLKTDSIGKVLRIDLPFERHQVKRIRIKLEVDSNPPAGSLFETSYIAFPTTTPITTQSLQSGFATKTHALLCRGYDKGRDWYDFIWYVSRRARPDLNLLQNALHQQGTWAGTAVDVTPRWCIAALRDAIDRVDWRAARNDLQRFLPHGEQASLSHWDATLFRFHLDRLEDYLVEGT
jgi:predicted nucleotidyltransferase component of viral defense system